MTGNLSLIVFMGLLVIVSIDHSFTDPVHVGAEPLQTVDGNRRFRSRLDRIGCNLVGGVQAAAKFKHACEARFASGENPRCQLIVSFECCRLYGGAHVP
jgi:hypothetical protein